MGWPVALAAFLLALMIVYVVVHSVVWLVTRSVPAAITGGTLAAITVGMHTFQAFVLVIGEYEEELTDYERLVQDHFVLLVLASMAAPAILVVAGHALWAGASGRARSTS